MVKRYLFCALLLFASIMTLRPAQHERRRVSASSLTMEDRTRRLGQYGVVLKDYEKALVKKAIAVESLAGIDLEEKRSTLTSIKKSLQTVHATQYHILVATHQISIIA